MANASKSIKFRWWWSLYDEHQVERRTTPIVHQFHLLLSHCKLFSSQLRSNCFRLDIQLWGFVSLFLFVTNWDFNGNATIFNRIKKLKEQFAHLYVVVTLPTRELNESFVRSYFKYEMQLGRPTFLPVQDIEMGFEKIVKVAHCRGVCKQHDAISKMKAEVG